MIDWNTVIATIFASSTMATIILTVIGVVARDLFSKILARDSEKFKASLEKDLESFKADLQKSAFEHQTRYQNLHSKRAEVIAELYSLLSQAERDASSLAGPLHFAGEPSPDEKLKQASKSGKELYEFFEKNRIYFKPESCEIIAKFNRELFLSLLDFNSAGYSQTAEDRAKEWNLVWKKITTELPSIKADIEQEFRGILGL
jgi:hypothetical protein